MSTEKMLKQFIDEVKEIINTDIFIENSKEKNGLKDNIPLIDIPLDDLTYTVKIPKESNLSLRERNLIRFILKEYLKNKYYLKPDIKNIISKLLNESMSNFEINEAIKNSGFNLDEGISVFSIKLFKEDNVKEIIALIENIDKENIIISKQDKDLLVILYQDNNVKEMNLARIIVDTIETEMFQKIKIGIGSKENILDIKKAYKESLTSLKLGIEYEIAKSIYNYKDLITYRILSTIPKEKLIDIYNSLVKKSFDNLDNSEIKTAMKFIENDLNLSLAARKLYIHRNTLIYRIEKIEKLTRFDLRKFKDALEFKLLLIIYKYLNEKHFG
ncbi:MAG: hypothetical protein FH753_16550 [Firmicutes bacterium]|nr:hypothetical protein [Bacillota bacterium]